VTPTSWLTAHEALLPEGGTALDVACGNGRNSLWLAARRFAVRAVDRDAAAVAALARKARMDGLTIMAEQLDLEAGGGMASPGTTYDVVVVVNYLHRPIFSDLIAAVRPGGVLVYETFTAAQAQRGKPTNPAFLLDPGELRQLVQPLEIVVEREGDFGGCSLASVIARKRVASA
jgi:2-polyprenyl-3-methyl-5-hydroxy-6-metoxy-1,4-benzoquinol methylase